MATVAELLAEIKRKAQVAANEANITDTDILTMATEEIRSVIAPKVLSVVEGYLVVIDDQTLSSVRAYRIPYWSVGNKVEDVLVSDGSAWRSLNQVDARNPQALEGFYIEGSHIVLTASAPTSGTLRLKCHARPAILTTTSAKQQGTVVSVDSATQITCSVSAMSPIQVDIMKATSPYEHIQVNKTQTGTAVVVSDSSKIAAGDLVMLTGYTLYPNIPEEIHDLLSQRVAIRVLEQLGHNEPRKILESKLADIEEYALKLLSPRVEGEEKVVWTGELLGYRTW